MKKQCTLMMLLLATMVFKPTRTFAFTLECPIKNVVESCSSSVDRTYVFRASGNGIVEAGQKKTFSVNIVEQIASEENYEVSFHVLNTSTGLSSVELSGSLIQFDSFIPIGDGVTRFQLNGQLPGIIDLQVTVRNSLGEIYSQQLEFDVRTDATTWISESWTNGIPDLGKIAIIDSEYNGSGFQANELQINENVSFTLGSGQILNLYGKINNLGLAVIEINASIIQIDETAINSGSIKYKRKTTPVRRFDFTYWGSPVAGYSLHDLSPLTLGDKFYSWNGDSQAWVTHMNGNVIMQAGKGYIVRAPQTHSTTIAEEYNAEFNGVPHNGPIPVNVSGSSSSEKLNLLSNPYPSAIDADLFMNHPDNENILGGTILLWSHTTLPNSTIPGGSQFNYSADDYAKFNATGGVKTASAANGGVTPNGKIASGQGFFIAAKENATVIFNNSMRVGENSQFFRTPNNINKSSSASLEKHRIWIKASNISGAYDETLLGYVQDATNGVDRSFDGSYIPANKAINIYSFIDNDKFIIQGKALPIGISSDTIRLGFKSTIASQYSIDIEALDGYFIQSNLPVFLEDSMTQISHNLKNGPYNFTTAIGTFDNRFRLRIPFGILSINDPGNNPEPIRFYGSSGKLFAKSKNSQIDTLEVYDLLGRSILKCDNINSNEYSTDISSLRNGIYIIKAKTSGGTITKKILL
ncbi:MAG: hypothetical protein DI589_18700 [Shinella sp.]|nr:MAG: hypothetical protein DI589_18700 [Shinella sp.]